MAESNNDKDDLLGKWTTDPDDVKSLQRFGRVSLEFTPDGWLIYATCGKGLEQEMLLTYRVQEGIIVTDQQVALREERTRYILTAEGKLILLHGHRRTRYVRT